MKVLFFANTSLYPHHFGVLMDEAEIMLRDGHEVYFCYCNKAIRCCTPNYFGKKSNCDLCVWTTKNALRRLSKDIHILKNGDYIPTKTVRPYEFNTLDDIRAIEYKNVQIGYGVLSTYISMTRNNEPIFDDVFKKYINTLLLISAQQTDACEAIIKEVNPDLVCPTLPKGTRVRQLEIKEGICYVDFNKSFQSKHPGGEIEERLTIYSIVNTLTELNDIDKVQFLIDGEKVEEYQGFIDFSQTFSRDDSIIQQAQPKLPLVQQKVENPTIVADPKKEDLEKILEANENK